METTELNIFFEILNENELNSIYGGTSEQGDDEYVIIYINGKPVKVKINRDGSITIIEYL